MKFSFKKKIAAASVAVALIGGGAAFAFWTNSGSGTGSASTGTSSLVTVHQTSVNAGLYPGATTPLSGTVENTSTTSAVTVSSVTGTVDTFSIRPDILKPACTQADFSITGTSNAPGSVAANNGTAAWSGLTLNMVDGAGNQDNCKNITVPITYASA